MPNPALIFTDPGTPPQAVQPLLGELDLVLVMTVNPGFGGQSFIASQIDKIKELRARIDASGRAIDLQVDGGINRSNAARAIAAGADVLVAGSATFADGNYGANIAALRGTPNTARNARKGTSPAAASGD
jgi:ribulose-phosphate 3-epimerase